MTCFLGVSWVDERTVALHWGVDPLEALSRRGGRTSPLYPVTRGEAGLSLTDVGSIALLFPRSPRATLSAAVDIWPDSLYRATYMSHGLASIVVFSPEAPEQLTDSLAPLADGLVAYEIWPHAAGRVAVNDVLYWRQSAPSCDPIAAIALDGLRDEVAVEVRQFNANLSLFRTSISEFAPEMLPLVVWLHESVTARVSAIRSESAPASKSVHAASRLHNEVSILVDVNSCLTMTISQLADVLPPVLNASFPSGEFSLLGIGAMSRAAWTVYEHMASIFDAARLVPRLEASFGRQGFDAGFRPSETDYAGWCSGPFAEDQVADRSHSEGRRHLVYFSSRWGFHETLNAISLSWQTISAGASREWNLLTLSHEFLHSLFRELVRARVLDFASESERDAFILAYNDEWEARGRGQDFRTSMQMFLVNQLKWVVEADAAVASAQNEGKTNHRLRSKRLTQARFAHLMVGPLLDTIEEVVVHIWDYHYFYNADDASYVASLWHSWAMVPFVRRKLRHYVLRTLFAMSSIEPTSDPLVALQSTMVRLERQFASLASEGSNPLIEEALAELQNEAALREWWIRFKYNYGLVVFTRHFLIDSQLHASLVRDSQSMAGPAPRYPIAPGEFPENRLESPTAFLVDRFASIDVGQQDTEYNSLWQLLCIL